jgi:phosphatidylglycerophosphatase C
MSRPLALFDFDNTLSLCDTTVLFALYCGGASKVFAPAAQLAAERLRGPIPRKRRKEVLYSSTLGGTKNAQLEELSERFAALILKAGMNENIVSELRRHKDGGARVIIVSASPEDYLRFIAEKLGVELLGTRLERSGDTVTGRVEGENCRGPEKIRRLGEILALSDYSPVIAYGDSEGDAEMLQASTEPHLRTGRSGTYYFKKSFRCVYLYLKCILAPCRRKSP